MTVDEIRRFIQTEILNEPGLEIAADENLLLSETLSSLSVAILVAHLQDSCDIRIPPEDVTLENFGTLQSIESYVSRSLASKG
jgi:acyl carrier protein